MLDRYRKIILATIACLTIGVPLANAAAQLSIAEKLSDILNSKEQVRQAIESHGVQVPTDTPLSQYPVKIRKIYKVIHANLTDICSTPANAGYFPYAICGNYTFNAAAYTWEGRSCALASGATTIYGRARCSNQRDYNYNFIDPRSVDYEPTDNPSTGLYCWCRLCSDSSRNSCGGWVYYHNSLGSACSSGCAEKCGDTIASENDNGSHAFGAALCAPPHEL